jgi:predicted AlkP superfamily pyrophosphatase or phosphodiesterase
VAGHGSVWDYDRQVPLLFWWPGVRSVTSGDPAETVDIAPTLAKVLGIVPPAIDGHCLPQVTACGTVPLPKTVGGERGR